MSRLVMRGVAVLALTLVPAAVRPLSAQTTLTSVQSLTFGQLIPGTPTTVAPTDIIKRGAFHVNGSATVTLQFVLPTVLTSPRGYTVPIVFGATQANVVTTKGTDVVDPRASFQIKLTTGKPDADVYIGGTAQPIAGQNAGTYTATITLMVVGGG